MKQLFIVKKTAALNGGASKPQDISAMTEGSIGFYKLSDDSAWLSAKADEDFAIACGTPANVPSRLFPEVDIKSLNVVLTEPKAGVAFSASVTIPTPVVGKDYTLVLVKLGTVPNQRNTWSATVRANGQTAAQIATALGNQIKNFAQGGTYDAGGGVNVSVTVSSAQITVTGNVAGEQYELKAGDALYGTTVTTTKAEPAIGDKAYIEKLAKQCAADKGFNYLDSESVDIYPGYPEAVENEQYNIFNLHFATTRKSGKTTDEPVMQYVHIAVPAGATSLATIKTILGVAAESNDDND
jgi:hypothetical protein